MNINTAQLERDILAVIADRLGVSVDAEIFRTSIPEGVPYGASVTITAFQPVMFDNFSFPSVEMSFVGKYATFDDATARAHSLARALPLFGVKSGLHRLNFLTATGSVPTVEWITDAGIQKYAVYWNFSVEIIESPQE